MKVEVRRNYEKVSPLQHNPGIELRFPQRPAWWVRRLIGGKREGGVGFRLSRNRKFWYAYTNPERERVVEHLVRLGDSIPEDNGELTTPPAYVRQKWERRIKGLNPPRQKRKLTNKVRPLPE